MRILLVYPSLPDTFWSFRYALRFVRKRASLPPLGLVTVAGLLPPEHEVRLVDENVGRLRSADLEWAEVAFVSGMVMQRDSARRVIARCRAAGVVTVGGGPLFTCGSDVSGDVDHLVLGEAEVALQPFLRDLAAGRPQPVYRAEGFADLRTSPRPRFELLDLRRYASASVQYSRGCPHDCEFCNVTTLFGRRFRRKSADQVLRELDSLYALGWRSGIFFADDNFIGSRKALRFELLPALEKWRRDKPGITFGTQASIDLADDAELTAQMVRAGFDVVFVGIETPDEAGLAECSKQTNRGRDLVEDVKTLQRAGLQVQGGFIVGFDHDTPAIFRRQFEFIQKSGITTAMVGLLQALPGTHLFRRLEAEGRIQGVSTGDNVDGTTNIRPAMGTGDLLQGYRRLLRDVYSPRHYYRRVRTFLAEYRDPRRISRIRMGEYVTFARTVLRLGVLGRERFQYWRLLLWALVRRRPLSLAVTLAVYGHHFRRVSRKHLA